jgi:hypothetical protein
MNAKLKELVHAMLGQTRENKLRWKPVVEDVFRTSVGGGLVRMSRSSRRMEDSHGDIEDCPTIRFVISDRNANVVYDEEVAEDELGYSASDSLFKEARRAAFDGDHVIEEMLASMGAGKT